jgi:hypothetical protein
MDAENTYNWLHVWIGAKHPSFEGYSLNSSDDVPLQMNNMTNEIVKDAITSDDSTIIGVSTMLDAGNEENTEVMNGANDTSALCTIRTSVLPKPLLIDATVNLAIDAMWKIIQPDDANTNNSHLFDNILSNNDHGSYRPVIPVSCESNEPIVEWTDNDKLLSGAFPDKFILGQGMPKGLLSERNWKHFAKYYNGQFGNPLFISCGFN